MVSMALLNMLNYTIYTCYLLYRFDLYVDVYGYQRDHHVPTHSVPTRPSSDLIPGLVALLTAAGKEPAVVPDTPGFVCNRLQFALFKEAALMVEERSEEHTSELQSLMRISYAAFCWTKKQLLKRQALSHATQPHILRILIDVTHTKNVTN